MYTAQVLDVMIASPGDTKEQREMIRQAVIEWNTFNARAFGVILLPVMWETHSLPGLEGRPQGMINEQLVDDADILIATFWTRLGSPTGEAASGTVEEITKFRDNNRPVHIYFCDIPVSLHTTDRAQAEAVENYRDELSKAGLFSSYITNDELRIKVRDDLTKRIRGMQEAGLIPRPSSTVTVQVGDSDDARAMETEAVNPLESIRRRLRGHLAAWNAKYQSFDGYSIDPRHDLMREVATTLFNDIQRVAAINPNSPILARLQEIAVAATGWADFRVYIDGGVSFNELSGGCRQVLDMVQEVIDEDWN